MITLNRMSLRWLLVALSWTTADFASAKESVLNVYGWLGGVDLFKTGRPDDWLGSDPIVGRQACPPLTRFDPGANKNEVVLLKSLPVDDAERGLKWIFTLRTGLRWWSGSTVTVQHLSEFLERELTYVLKEAGNDAKFKIELKSGNAEVTWSKAVSFGPLAVANHAFWQPSRASVVGYECAGLYQITEVRPNVSVTLALTPGYKATYQKINVILNEEKRDAPFIAFDAGITPQTQSRTPQVRSCTAKLDLPMVSAIVWNPKSKAMNSAKMRQAVTSAIPRGELMRTVSGDLGALVSVPALRAHPGYSSNLSVRPFNLEAAHAMMNSDGYVQATVGTPRVGPDGQPFRLKIAVGNGARHELVEKVISDSLASIGVEMEFIPVGISAAEVEPFDGFLAGLSLPWPSLDLSKTLHSQVSGTQHGFPFFTLNDKPLDDALDSYAVSVTKEKPRTDLLAKVLGRFVELEPWSVLMSHQACLSTKEFALKGKITVNDPDWFRRHLLN